MTASWAVVTPTFNRADRLPRLIAALEAQVDAPEFELIVVDDASTDATAIVLEQLSKTASFPMRWRKQGRNQGPAAARNVGWRLAQSDFVAFLDDDCAPDAGWLRALSVAAATADVVQGITTPDLSQREQLGPFSRTITVTGLSGFFETCNIAYRRALLSQLGGFVAALGIAGEDTDLGLRAVGMGAGAVCAHDAIVLHDVRPSSFWTHVSDLWRWHTVPATIARHPELRDRLLYHRVFWKPTHASALLAVAGLCCVTGSHRRWYRYLLIGATIPYVWQRVVSQPLPHTTPRQRILLLPAALVCDLVEVGVCIGGSIEARSLTL